MLALAAAVEQGSEHPIGEAIVARAKERGWRCPPVSGFQAVPGQGIDAPRVADGMRAARQPCAHGRRAACDVDAARVARADGAGGRGQDGGVPGARRADSSVWSRWPTRSSRRRAPPWTVSVPSGLDVVMLTGDHRATAAAIARAGRHRSRAGRGAAGGQGARGDAPAGRGPPGGHGRRRHQRRARPRPGRRRHRHGLGHRRGHGGRRRHAHAQRSRAAWWLPLDLSRRTIRIVKENLVWAFGYNVVLIPVAAGLLYPLWGILLSPILAGSRWPSPRCRW